MPLSSPSSESTENTLPPSAPRIHWPLFGSVVAICFLGMLLFGSEVAREVTFTTLTSMFALFSTPFVLEASSVIIFSIALLTYNQWRRSKEGDDWVYLVTQENDDPALPPSITQRLQSTIVESKPDSEIEASTDFGILEGYLELGMASQALAELKKLPDTDDSLDWSLLKIRIFAANLNSSEAQGEITNALNSHPDSTTVLARTSLDNAFWLRKHLKQNDLVAQWTQIALALDSSIFNELTANDPLRVLKPEQ